MLRVARNAPKVGNEDISMITGNAIHTCGNMSHSNECMGKVRLCNKSFDENICIYGIAQY